jgi:hypothetical protein
MERMDNSEVLREELENDMEVTFEKRFGWYVVLNRVTENRITEHDEVLGKKVVEVLNQLLYLVEYDKEQVKEQKKAMGKI